MGIPENFYKEMDKMFDDIGIKLEDTNDKDKIMNADMFIATFIPDKEPIIIE